MRRCPGTYGDEEDPCGRRGGHGGDCGPSSMDYAPRAQGRAPGATSTPRLLSAAELAAIGERVRAATPGPWETDGGNVVETAEPLDDGSYDGDRADVCEVLHYHAAGSTEDHGTALFIAHSRTDVPALLGHMAAQEERYAAGLAVAAQEIGELRAEVARLDRLAKAERRYRLTIAINPPCADDACPCATSIARAYLIAAGGEP